MSNTLVAIMIYDGGVLVPHLGQAIVPQQTLKQFPALQAILNMKLK
jgi:hypothetical protein